MIKLKPKIQSIKLSDYFEIVRPEYVFLRLTPTTSVRNYNSEKIAKTIASMYKRFSLRIKKHDKKYFFQVPERVGYMIYMYKGGVEFYFIAPKQHQNLLKSLMQETWKGIAINQVDYLPSFSNKAIKYRLNYKYEDALSLSADCRNNQLLSSILGKIDILEDKDRVAICYDFIPVSQKSWKPEYRDAMQRVKQGLPTERTALTTSFILKWVFSGLVIIIDTTFDAIFSFFGTKNSIPKFQLDPMQVSSATKQKQHSPVLGVKISVVTDGNPASGYAICEAFEAISEDNQLIIGGERMSKMSPKECQSLLSLPGRELLEEHGCIEKIATLESPVPKELQKGVMCIGESSCQGAKQKAYMTTDRELKNLTLTIVGPARAGKSTLISNLSRDAVLNGETVIIFDFCGNNELSDSVCRYIPQSKILNIDCEKHLQGLGYNEIKGSSSPFEAYRNAKLQTSQLVTLINSINASDRHLSAKMDRFLESAALIVFISGGSIKDVFTVLQNHRTREEFIRKIPPEQKENLLEYVLYLSELDEEVKGEIIGSKLNSIAGIIDRINRLKQNPYMELMLKKDCSENIDLIEEMQKGQLICLRMPEVMFSTESEKDIYTTYWATKVWLALQARKWIIKDLVKVNWVIDELYQVPHTQEFIRSKLSQMPKFAGKMILSCHYLGQISIIRNELKSANSSYLLLAGCDKDNYKELKEELYPYTVEDLLNLRRYHSLNLIKYERGYAKFITKLPYR